MLLDFRDIPVGELFMVDRQSLDLPGQERAEAFSDRQRAVQQTLIVGVLRREP
jgi:hypothetical protein